ncbi:MAG TPA: UPF0182 family protein [Gemmatimonadaceae bacterium]|nr:UPF0182 family protein [Gemmatimonadaceae bacterium]
MTKRRLLLVALAAAALLLVGRVAAALYADYAWYAALDAAGLWRAKVVNTLLLRGSAWLAGTGFVFANLLAVRVSVLKLVVPRRVANLEIDAEVPGRLLVGGAALVSVGVGALLALAQDDWTTLAVARYATPFRETDPYFIKDFAFWTALLPLERAWYAWAQLALVLVSALVVTLYALTSSLRWERGALRVAGYVRRHLAVLAGLLLLLLAWSYRLERFRLLVDGGPAGYFGYVEHHALAPLFVLALITAACAVMVFWAGYVGQVRLALAGVALAIVAAVGLQPVARLLIRWNARTLSPAITEEPYLGTRARFTQRAYGVRGGLEEPDSTLAFPDLAALGGHVSVWDEATLVAAVEQGGRRRDVVAPVGWRPDATGRLEAVLAARETAADADDGTPWVAVVAGASDVDPASGTPRLATHELPRVLVQPDAAGYVVVDDAAGVLAAPPLRSGWQRLAHALAVQNLRVFVDGRGDAVPRRFVDHRGLQERVGRLAPAFRQAARPTPLLLADSLYWVVQLYSMSATYPLSQPLRVRSGGTETSGVKFFRHAATAIANAHTGRVRIYRAPQPDPLAASWMARFGRLFHDWRTAPPALRSAVPPPVEGIVAQTVALATAGGATEPPNALRLPDREREPGDSAATNSTLLPFLLPREGTLAVGLPLVGRADERLRLLVIGTGGAESRTVAVPVTPPAAAWPALADTLRDVAAASAGSAGASGARDAADLAYDEVRVLPVGDGVALLRAAYGARRDGPPTLAAVTLLAGDSLHAGTSLAEALGVAPPTNSELPDDPAALWRAMRDALQRADWRAFGDAFDRLGRVLGGRGR